MRWAPLQKSFTAGCAISIIVFAAATCLVPCTATVLIDGRGTSPADPQSSLKSLPDLKEQDCASMVFSILRPITLVGPVSEHNMNCKSSCEKEFTILEKLIEDYIAMADHTIADSLQRRPPASPNAAFDHLLASTLTSIDVCQMTNSVCFGEKSVIFATDTVECETQREGQCRGFLTDIHTCMCQVELLLPLVQYDPEDPDPTPLCTPANVCYRMNEEVKLRHWLCVESQLKERKFCDSLETLEGDCLCMGEHRDCRSITIWNGYNGLWSNQNGVHSRQPIPTESHASNIPGTGRLAQLNQPPGFGVNFEPGSTSGTAQSSLWLSLDDLGPPSKRVRIGDVTLADVDPTSESLPVAELLSDEGFSRTDAEFGDEESSGSPRNPFDFL